MAYKAICWGQILTLDAAVTSTLTLLFWAESFGNILVFDDSCVHYLLGQHGQGCSDTLTGY